MFDNAAMIPRSKDHRTLISTAALAFAYIAVTLFLTGCHYSDQPVDINGTGPRIAGDGMQAFPTPRTSYPPGTIFRTDQSGKVFLVADLTRLEWIKPEDLTISTEYFYEYARTINSDAGFTGRYLDPAGYGVDAGLSTTTVANLRLKLDKGLREELSDVKALAAVRRFFDENSMLQGSKYFLVRATVSFNQISFESSTTSNLTAEAKGELLRLASLDSALSQHSAEILALTRVFAPPARVLFLAEEIQPDKGLSGAIHGYSLSASDDAFPNAGW